MWTLWDLGGSQSIRSIWAHYARSAEGIIFVIDGKDEEHLLEAKQAFFTVLDYCTEGTIPPILVLLNKFDLPHEEVPESTLKFVQSWSLGFQTIDQSMDHNIRAFTVAKVSARTGNGVIDAFAQLSTSLIHSEAT